MNKKKRISIIMRPMEYELKSDEKWGLILEEDESWHQRNSMTEILNQYSFSITKKSWFWRSKELTNDEDVARLIWGEESYRPKLHW